MKLRRNLFDAWLITLLFGLTLSIPANGDHSPAGREVTIEHAEVCSSVVAKLQEKIDKLKDELSKGGRIYTPTEIKMLESKLKETDKLLDSMMFRPGDEKITATTEKTGSSAGGPADP